MHDHGAGNYLLRLNSILLLEKGDIFKVSVFAFAVAVLSLVIPIAVENLVHLPSFGRAHQGHAVLPCGMHAKKIVCLHGQEIE